MQELLKRLQDRHDECAQAVAKKAAADVTSTATVSPDTPNVIQTIMQLDQTNTRTKASNKVPLEAEKLLFLHVMGIMSCPKYISLPDVDIT